VSIITWIESGGSAQHRSPAVSTHITQYPCTITMAARSKTALAVGSAPWIENERDQAQQFHELEVEEFGYAARNELEWLNEHMAEIFSRDQR